jgi:23S rRNA (uracil1939-C5)-methyltransferase
VSGLCRHFGTCGGCTLQDVPPKDYLDGKRQAVVRALARHGLESVEVAAPVAVAPGTRRRAVFKIARRATGTEIGFHALKSHSIVDMEECRVLTPALVALVPRLRAAMTTLLPAGQHAEAHVTEADNGLDVAVRAGMKLTPALAASLAGAALKAVRITWNGALAFESAAPSVRFGKAEVKLPVEAFLQPTRDGEAALLAGVREAVIGAKTIADLFSGCGTFSLPLAQQARVHAVEREAAMLAELAAAARATSGLKPVTTEKRDLFKLPLTAAELNRYDAVTLDPPRAGAQAQTSELARSKVPRIAYVSCDAESFARDAAILIGSGYRLGRVIPVDQFLWSSHIELVGSFGR